MQISAHCVLPADRREFHFQAVRAHQELPSVPCVGVSLNVSHPLASGECDAGAHLSHFKHETVTGTSGHTVRLWSFLSLRPLAASLPAARLWERVGYNELEMYDLMRRLTRNKEWTFVRAPWAERCREVMKDVIWEGRGTNHVGLLVASQTVFTERLIQAAVRGETIDSLLQRKMIAFTGKWVWHLALCHRFCRSG